VIDHPIDALMIQRMCREAEIVLMLPPGPVLSVTVPEGPPLVAVLWEDVLPEKTPNDTE
jgi:hypothetical protein